MDWMIAGITILGVFIANAAMIIPLFLWNRTETRADIRHMDAKLDSNRELIREVHNESKHMITAIQNEIKDFHYRLLEIERNKK